MIRHRTYYALSLLQFLLCDVQTLNWLDSADAFVGTEATGAMSWAFISALKANPKQSYVELLNSVREILETKYTQKPQLSCSHPLSMLFL